MRAHVSYFLRKNFQAEIINISAAHFFFPRLFVGVRPHFPLFLPLFHDSLLLFVVSSRVFPSFRSGKRKQIDPEMQRKWKVGREEERSTHTLYCRSLRKIWSCEKIASVEWDYCVSKIRVKLGLNND